MVADLPEVTARVGRRGGFREEARSEWAALGPLGRTVLIALTVSAVVAVILAVTIPNQVERYLIDAEIGTITRISGDFEDEGFIPPDPTNPDSLSALDDAVRLYLLGSDIVRVKVWSPEGTILYSDVPDLIGFSYPPGEARLAAFSGTPSVELTDSSSPENAFERGLPPLREFYIPVVDDNGSVVSVFEVYHVADHIDVTVGDVSTYVWWSVGGAIALLGLFVALLIIANGRAINRRRELTESLFADLVRSQAEERTRIVGSLHDDIGQSLYRVHFGLEDLKARVDGSNQEIVDELDHMGSLVHDVDNSLRAELRLLQYGTGEEIALAPALGELAEVTEMESDLDVSVLVETEGGLSATSRIALFRAAREAVTNVRKHAGANSVDIHVHRKGRNVRLLVRDDGIGMVDDHGLGLKTTRERLEAVGGGLRLTTSREGGTEFMAWVPMGE